MNEDQHDHEKENAQANNRHMIMMVLCCAIPMIAPGGRLCIVSWKPLPGFYGISSMPVNDGVHAFAKLVHSKKESGRTYLAVSN